MEQKISPMMTKYLETKDKYKDAILFYRLGDFYEMFFDDAVLCSKVLDLTLTGKDCGLKDKAPMCGIPFHAAESYITKLVENGYKVAICEQLSAPTRGSLVERDVVRIVTPGTLQENLEDKKNNYLCSIYYSNKNFGVVYVDITTGELKLLELTSKQELEDMLIRIAPSEIICNSEMKYFESEIESFNRNVLPKMFVMEDYVFGFTRSEKYAKEQFGVNNLSVFDASDKKYGICALGGLLEYLKETQKRTLSNINKIRVERNNIFMNLDSTARKNLELTESMSTKKKRGSILWLLDNTKTAMGGRLIRKYVEQPVIIPSIINDRLNAVEELINNRQILLEFNNNLSKIVDIERIVGKLSYGTIMPKDCISLASSLEVLPYIQNSLSYLSSSYFRECSKKLVDMSYVKDLLFSAIKRDPPNILTNGGYINEKYNRDLDDYRNAEKLGRQWVSSIEQKEREETGIKTLKVGYNKVFGYYIEVTKANLEHVPYSYIRKQTTVNSERFITEELKKLEEKILGSEEKALKLEAKLYSELKDYLKQYIQVLQNIASAISVIDTICSLANVAIEHNFVKPEINENIKSIEIKGGRHPIVETLLKNSSFVPNDTILDNSDNRTMIITGPNMAGKSTYMRQVAVITLLAHIGSFVPCESAKIALTDRIFTRIGASDDLAFGESTFMVEMNEVANILNNATENSLLILDEIGRGTSTYDGLSIAWAVMEYLSQNLKAKTLFATHYHELAELEGKLDGVKNYKVSVKETATDIVFLHKIMRGSANKSFGIEVASLAGLPKSLTDRAREILKREESKEKTIIPSLNEEKVTDVKTGAEAEVINILKEINIDSLSPLKAFNTIIDLVSKLK